LNRVTLTRFLNKIDEDDTTYPVIICFQIYRFPNLKKKKIACTGSFCLGSSTIISI